MLCTQHYNMFQVMWQIKEIISPISLTFKKILIVVIIE